jgi:hypothetical protein
MGEERDAVAWSVIRGPCSVKRDEVMLRSGQAGAQRAAPLHEVAPMGCSIWSWTNWGDRESGAAASRCALEQLPRGDADLRRDFLPQDRPTRAVPQRVEAATPGRMAFRNWRGPLLASSWLLA